MDEGSKPSSRFTLFRDTILKFITERKEAKLKGNEDFDAASKYGYTTWLADAARRVTQIQAVTHVLKATHPDARGSSLHVAPQALPQHAEIGTHLLGDNYADDIVGNAAALDVYKFLKLKVEDRRLLDWLKDNDADLLQALNPDPATASEWASAFKSLIRPSTTLASHALAKQVYWCVSGEPVDNAGFHLLQPLASSSLAHAVHQDISEARFGDANKASRKAWKAKQPHHEPYYEYEHLVVRKLGGTKPQNISQLNSERGGVNYLLTSSPPTWTLDRPTPLLSIESALDRFFYYDGVRQQINLLSDFMKREGTRTQPREIERNKIEQRLGQLLAEFGLTTREQFEPGWSRHPDCTLALSEQLWLDPERAHLEPREEHQQEDQAFITAFESKNWSAEVAQRYGQWLNAILRKRKLAVGDTEQAHWASQALSDLDPAVRYGPSPLKRSPKDASHG